MLMAMNVWKFQWRRYDARPAFFVYGLSLFALLALALLVRADARSDYLIRLLRESSQFRVRAQAAISLGNVRSDPAAIEALVKALSDENAAVRAASASSLERIGDPSALPALRLALKDDEQVVRTAAKRAIVAASNRPTKSTITEPTPTTSVGPSVPSGPPRYYVGIGMPGTRASSVDRETLRGAKQFIETQVRQIDGVVIAAEKETPAKVRLLLKSKKMDGYYLDSSLVTLEQTPEGGVRAVVSIIVGTYPERNMRTILQGSARVTGNATTARTLAIEGAFRGALRQLPKVLSLVNQ